VCAWSGLRPIKTGWPQRLGWPAKAALIAFGHPPILARADDPIGRRLKKLKVR
jgi:hypothetical protein